MIPAPFCESPSRQFYRLRGKTKPFLLGKNYRTNGGENILIVETQGKEAVMGDDGLWRYNRDHDRGRLTGGAHDDLRCLIPELS